MAEVNLVCNKINNFTGILEKYVSLNLSSASQRVEKDPGGKGSLKNKQGSIPHICDYKQKGT